MSLSVASALARGTKAPVFPGVAQVTEVRAAGPAAVTRRLFHGLPATGHHPAAIEYEALAATHRLAALVSHHRARRTSAANRRLGICGNALVSREGGYMQE